MFFDYKHAKRLELPWYFETESLYEEEFLVNERFLVIPKDKNNRIGWFYDRFLQKTWYENESMIFLPFGRKIKEDVVMFKWYFEFSNYKKLSREEEEAIKILRKTNIISNQIAEKLLYESYYLRDMRDIKYSWRGR